MAIQYNNQSEIEALSAQTRTPSNRLSDQRVAMFGSSRPGNIRARLRGIRQADTQASYITDSTNASTISNYPNEQLKNFHLNDKYLLQTILSLPNIKHYYPLNETVAGNARDLVSGFDGTVTGATIAQSGKAGRGYLFDGINDKITFPLWSDTTTNITIGAIFKSNDYTKNGQTIMSNGIGTNGTGRGYSLVLSGNATTDGSLFILDHSVKWVDTTYNIQDNNPHFIVLVLNSAGNPTVYVDGVSVYSPGSNTFATPNGDGSLIGEGGDGSFPRWAKGVIQHGFIVSRSLTSDEVLKIARVAGLA